MKRLFFAILLSLSFVAPAIAQQTVEERITALEGSDNNLVDRVAALEAIPPVDLSVLEAQLAILEAIEHFSIPVITEITDQNVPIIPGVNDADLTFVMPETGNFAVLAPDRGFHRFPSVQIASSFLAVREGDGSDPTVPSKSMRTVFHHDLTLNLLLEVRLPAGWMFVCGRGCF